MTQRILVPTDLSDSSEPAIRYGAMLRDRLNASLTILFADVSGFTTMAESRDAEEVGEAMN